MVIGVVIGWAFGIILAISICVVARLQGESISIGHVMLGVALVVICSVGGAYVGRQIGLRGR